MKTKITALVCQKGGVGKSTTSLALTAGLALRGYKVAVIDTDPQCNLTSTCRTSPEGATVLGLLMKEVEAKEAIRHLEKFDIIPANKNLSGADIFISDVGKEFRLKEALEPLKGVYNFIIVDTPPSLGIITVNALTASDSIVIPAQADIYSLQGIEMLVSTIDVVRKYCNHNLVIDGILLTRFNSRTVLSQDIARAANKLAAKLGTKVFKSTIREAVAVKESQLLRKDLFDYASDSKVAGDYSNFIDEFLKG